MKNLGMFVTQVVVVVGALAAYHMMFHGDRDRSGEGTGAELIGGGLGERMEIEAALRSAEGVTPETYDADAVRGLLRKSDIELPADKEEVILPLLHDHLLKLRANLRDAHRAVVDGVPEVQRARFRAKAAGIHGALHARLKSLIPQDQAAKLYAALPAMMPPVPGSTSPTPKPQPKPLPPISMTEKPEESK